MNKPACLRLSILELSKISMFYSNGIRTHIHLVRKRTLNYFAKLAKNWPRPAMIITYNQCMSFGMIM